MKLIDMMAKSCVYAQEHIDERTEAALECTSHQIACFLAQNTIDGMDGVESEVVLDDLVGPVKSEEEWRQVIQEKVKSLGGWKVNKKFSVNKQWKCECGASYDFPPWNKETIHKCKVCGLKHSILRGGVEPLHNKEINL